MHVIAVLFLLYGVWTILWAIGISAAFFWAPADAMERVDSIVPARVQYSLPPALLVVGSFANLAGVGLLRRAEWGRPTATLMALVSLPFVPFGTIFGALALWWLSRSAQATEVSEARAPSASV